MKERVALTLGACAVAAGIGVWAITWYVDGQQIMVVHNHSPRQLMYLVANLADFKALPQGCAGQLLLRSAQVWQRPPG
jgi:hypothetical protein